MDFQTALTQVADTSRWLDADSLADVVSHVPAFTGDDLTEGEIVTIRADLDLPVTDGVVIDTARLDACLPVVQTCLDAGAIPVLIGHIGRKPEQTLRPVRDVWAERLGVEVHFVDSWFDEDTLEVTAAATDTLAAAKPGEVVMFENARQLQIEMGQWKLDDAELAAQAERLETASTRIAAALGDTLVLECIAASNFDFSSSIMSLAFDSVRLGPFLARELGPPMQAALDADILFMSGLKANKLDDLQAMISTRSFSMIVVAGAIALPLAHAQAEARGGRFELGRVGTDESNVAYVPPARLAQAADIVASCQDAGIKLVLPIDFVTEDREIVAGLTPNDIQLDIGPRSVMMFEQEFETAMRNGAGSLFFNGAPGKYEDAEFSMGTEALVGVVGNLRADGLKVYVGGGDGRAAYDRYGDLERVTHAFTGGGTVLKLLAGKSIAFLNAAMAVANR